MLLALTALTNDLGADYGPRIVSCHEWRKTKHAAMQLRANNLANVSTTGFRADLAQARSMQLTVKGSQVASSV